MIKNILVTGGAGYIGSHVNEILVKNKKQVCIIDNLSTGHKKLINKKAKFFKLDILKTDKINNILKKYSIGSVIHLAAALSVGESQKKPSKYKKINVQGTQNLLNAIKNTNVKNFIFSSTCAVYQDGKSFVTEKTKVIGKDAHPFFLWAKNNHGRSAIPKWNFHKIVIGKNGKIASTFSSITNPSSDRFVKAIENELKN